MNLSGAWFTAVRMDRMIKILHHIPSRRVPERVARVNAHRLLFPVAGGSSSEIQSCLQVLGTLRLVSNDDLVHRTPDGDRVIRAIKNGDGGAFALVVLRSGFLGDQIQHLISVARYEDEELVFEAVRMRPMGVQLLGVLTHLPEFSSGSLCRIRGGLKSEIESAWALRPRPSQTVGFTGDRTEVGFLGEQYSLQWERDRRVSNDIKVHWIALEDSAAGYDIEVRNGDQLRRIEVKASQSPKVSFLLSDPEWTAAGRYAAGYEIHFWGSVRPGEMPEVGYRRLLDAGFPIVIEQPCRTLLAEPWVLSTQVWRVRRSDGNLF